MYLWNPIWQIILTKFFRIFYLTYFYDNLSEVHCAIPSGILSGIAHDIGWAIFLACSCIPSKNILHFVYSNIIYIYIYLNLNSCIHRHPPPLLEHGKKYPWVCTFDPSNVLCQGSDIGKVKLVRSKVPLASLSNPRIKVKANWHANFTPQVCTRSRYSFVKRSEKKHWDSSDLFLQGCQCKIFQKPFQQTLLFKHCQMTALSPKQTRASSLPKSAGLKAALIAAAAVGPPVASSRQSGSDWWTARRPRTGRCPGPRPGHWWGRATHAKKDRPQPVGAKQRKKNNTLAQPCPHTYSGREKLTKRKPRLIETQLATIGDGVKDEGMHEQVIALVAFRVNLWHKLLEELLHTAQHLDIGQLINATKNLNSKRAL